MRHQSALLAVSNWLQLWDMLRSFILFSYTLLRLLLCIITVYCSVSQAVAVCHLWTVAHNGCEERPPSTNRPYRTIRGRTFCTSTSRHQTNETRCRPVGCARTWILRPNGNNFFASAALLLGCSGKKSKKSKKSNKSKNFG